MIDVGARTQTGYTPLHMCAFHGNVAGIALLVAAGADKAAQETHHKVNAAELVMMNARLRFGGSDGTAAGSEVEDKCLAALAPLPANTRSRAQLEDELLAL